MALPNSGIMTAGMINTELGRASNSSLFRIGGSQERALAGKPSGQIRFSDFRGKSSRTFAEFPTLSGIRGTFQQAGGSLYLSGSTRKLWVAGGRLTPPSSSSSFYIPPSGVDWIDSPIGSNEALEVVMTGHSQTGGWVFSHVLTTWTSIHSGITSLTLLTWNMQAMAGKSSTIRLLVRDADVGVTISDRTITLVGD